jgi:hypothetical protein
MSTATVESVINQPGEQLDPSLRWEMEGLFQQDFADVRVHHDSAAAVSAAALQAEAYTVGDHIVFGRAQYQPGTHAGMRLLAHELTHVVQQRVGPVAGTATGADFGISSPGDVFERAAESHADLIMSMTDTPIQPAPLAPPVRSTGMQVQRQSDGATGTDATSSNRCYTCDIGGGIGVCCYQEGAPIIPECLELGKRIIDSCKDPNPQGCLAQAECAQCQCIAARAGSQYCQCTGIV